MAHKKKKQPKEDSKKKPKESGEDQPQTGKEQTAEQNEPQTPPVPAAAGSPPAPPAPPKPKPYDEVITEEAVTQEGLFDVHQVGTKWYFELAPDILGKDMIWYAEFAEAPYGVAANPKELGKRIVRWERLDNRIEVRDMTGSLRLRPAFAVASSQVEPEPEDLAIEAVAFPSILYSFPVVAEGEGDTAVIEITTFFAGNLLDFDVTPVLKMSGYMATAAGRAELAEAAGLDRAGVDAVAYNLDLGRVRGVGRKSVALLNAAGIESVGELAEYEPEELAGLLITANEEGHVVEHMPSVDTLTYWIEQSRELPPYLVAIKVLKEMLNVDAYSWQAMKGDDPTKRRADAIMFNRKEGYEVRLMIQKICNTFGFTSEEDVKRVEEVIANELPGNVRSQENVYNWLVNYFETH